MQKFGSMIVLFLMMIGLTACGFETVDTGHRGVKVHYGEVENLSLTEGLYFYNPFTVDLIEMDCRTNSFEGDLTTYTKDVQQAQIKMTLMANPQKDTVHILYRDYGYKWDEKILNASIQGALKAVIGKWDAVDLIANREKARAEIEDMLRISLKEKHVELVKFEITDISYADEFEKSVERKVVAVQSAIEEQNRTVQIKEKAEQQVIAARAEAESMRIRANALSQNKALVEYEAVQKWDGVLPQYMMGNTIPFMSISK